MKFALVQPHGATCPKVPEGLTDLKIATGTPTEVKNLTMDSIKDGVLLKTSIAVQHQFMKDCFFKQKIPDSQQTALDVTGSKCGYEWN